MIYPSAENTISKPIINASIYKSSSDLIFFKIFLKINKSINDESITIKTIKTAFNNPIDSFTSSSLLKVIHNGITTILKILVFCHEFKI